jgi:hypothetical protein
MVKKYGRMLTRSNFFIGVLRAVIISLVGHLEVRLKTAQVRLATMNLLRSDERSQKITSSSN